MPIRVIRVIRGQNRLLSLHPSAANFFRENFVRARPAQGMVDS
jgi:hypothetical protein